MGDYLLLGVLQSARDGAHAARLERELRRLEVISMLDTGTAVRAARKYRRLRALGITISRLYHPARPVTALGGFLPVRLRVGIGGNQTFHTTSTAAAAASRGC